MNDRRKVKVSKFLSFVLRHQPDAAGIALDANGWVPVDQLIDGAKKNGNAFTIDELKEVVATNDKKRFAFSDDGKLIRASQGHSIDVDLDYKPAVPPPTLYHGTATRFIESICKEGLTKQGRNHVHLSADCETATKVGQRHGKPLILTIKASEMHGSGFSFFLSANNVWLCEKVPVNFIVFPDGSWTSPENKKYETPDPDSDNNGCWSSLVR